MKQLEITNRILNPLWNREVSQPQFVFFSAYQLSHSYLTEYSGGTLEFNPKSELRIIPNLHPALCAYQFHLGRGSGEALLSDRIIFCVWDFREYEWQAAKHFSRIHRALRRIPASHSFRIHFQQCLATEKEGSYKVTKGGSQPLRLRDCTLGLYFMNVRPEQY